MNDVLIGAVTVTCCTVLIAAPLLAARWWQVWRHRVVYRCQRCQWAAKDRSVHNLAVAILIHRCPKDRTHVTERRAE